MAVSGRSRFELRVPRGTLAAWALAAAEEGVTLSEWVRAAAADRIEVQRVEAEERAVRDRLALSMYPQAQ